jgi:hypothetical protein
MEMEQVLPAYTTHENGTQRSETSVHKVQNPGNHSKERIENKKKLGGYLSEVMRFQRPLLFLPVPLQPNTRHGSLIHEVSISHTTTHHSR